MDGVEKCQREMLYRASGSAIQAAFVDRRVQVRGKPAQASQQSPAENIVQLTEPPRVVRLGKREE